MNTDPICDFPPEPKSLFLRAGEKASQYSMNTLGTDCAKI